MAADTAHLADLHAQAAELGIEGYRKLRREELERRISERGGSVETPAPASDEVVVEGTVVPADAETPVEADAAGPRGRDEPTESVSGVLEVLPQRYGFLRLRGLEPNPGDVYVSASQIRRCELRSGDTVAGPARAPRRGERHRALVHVDEVNGTEPTEAPRPEFESLPAILPERRVPLDGDPTDVLARAVDLLAPLALGQRVLVRAAPRSGRTTLLRSVCRALTSTGDVETTVLLIDERPEEGTAWREAVPEAQFAVATGDTAPRDQVALARLALERASRTAEAGGDAALIVDSLSRLAVADGGVRTVKRLFGSGRNVAGGGSLTVVATTVEGADDDEEADRAVITTESSLITLAPQLAATGTFPAIDTAGCRVSNEEALRPPEELDAVRRLRSLLADLAPSEAAGLLRERIEATPSNAELLAGL